ncbi:MAG: branched-chain amino acid ABC transporter substrate-binding protein [Phototrophicaceae bacterium]
MKRFLLILALLSALVMLAVPTVVAQDACEDELGCVEIGADDPIVIATMLVRSGPNALLGEDSAGAVEIAVAQRDGMLLGRDIEVVDEDSLCSAEGGQAAAQRVVSDASVLGVIGTNCSGAAAAALPIISEAGLLMISPSNTSPALTNDDIEAGGLYQPGYFRTAHNDLFQGRLAAQYASIVLGATTVATIHDGDPYTEGLQGAMADAFLEIGGEVVFQGAITKGDTDMTAILTEIAAANPDVLYFPVFEPESNFLAAQARQTPGLENTVLMTADGSFVSSFVANTGDAALGMFQSGPFVSGEAYDAFLVSWDEEIGGVPPSGFHAHAYDATNMLLNAIEAVAVELEDGTLLIGRQALRDAVAATTEYAGLTGTLTCQTESPFLGDCATGEGLAIFELTQEELDGNWPPAPIWTPADAAMMEEESEG